MKLKRKNRPHRKEGAVDDDPNGESREMLAPDSRDTPGRQPIGRKHVKQQVEEVKEALHDNINQLRDRGEKVGDLVNKSNKLLSSVAVFKDNTTRIELKTRKSSRWLSKKTITLIVIGIVLLVIIIIVIIVSTV